MIPDRFWLTDTQFAKIFLYSATDKRVDARGDDRRVVGGIVQVLWSIGG